MVTGLAADKKRSGPAWLGLTTAAIIVFTAVAGCIESAPETEDESAEQTFSLESAPRWQVGQWWTVEVEDTLSGTTTESTLVVTEVTESTATLGMPADDFHHRFFIYHLPPLGTIEMDTFSWNVMGHSFDALQFPLEEGQEWTSVFHSLEYGWEVQAEVMDVKDTTAEVRMIGDNVIIDLTYDAEMGMISHFQADAYGVGFHVVDHGVGYEGEVKSPSGIDLGFVDGRVGTVLDASATPGAPIITMDVDKEASHGTLALMVSGVPQLGTAGPGVYRASATSPGGVTHENTFTPTPQEPLFLTELHGVEDVQGTWELEFASAGPGWVGIELIVYDLTQSTLSNPAPEEAPWNAPASH